MTNETMSSYLIAITGKWGATLLIVFSRAFIIMFIAAVVAKRTTVFAPISYWESLAWAAGYGMVRELIHKEDE